MKYYAKRHLLRWRFCVAFLGCKFASKRAVSKGMTRPSKNAGIFCPALGLTSLVWVRRGRGYMLFSYDGAVLPALLRVTTRDGVWCTPYEKSAKDALQFQNGFAVLYRAEPILCISTQKCARLSPLSRLASKPSKFCADERSEWSKTETCLQATGVSYESDLPLLS